MTLKFNCTNCGKEIIVQFLKPGEIAKCRNCGAEVTVPGDAGETDEQPVYASQRISQQEEEHLGIVQKESLAGRGQRFLARLIDSLIPAAPVVFFILAIEFIPWVVVGILALLAVLVIQILFLSMFGQTIGKSIVKIKIVKISNGKNGGFVTNFLLREIVNGILTLIPFYSLIDILLIFREDRRCIHDFIAGTCVVRE